jgi:hypothetical protein
MFLHGSNTLHQIPTFLFTGQLLTSEFVPRHFHHLPLMPLPLFIFLLMLFYSYSFISILKLFPRPVFLERQYSIGQMWYEVLELDLLCFLQWITGSFWDSNIFTLIKCSTWYLSILLCRISQKRHKLNQLWKQSPFK